MVGSGLKKFATENGMKVAQGVAYGNLQGFAATMVEGANIKVTHLPHTLWMRSRKDSLRRR